MQQARIRDAPSGEPKRVVMDAGASTFIVFRLSSTSSALAGGGEPMMGVKIIDMLGEEVLVTERL